MPIFSLTDFIIYYCLNCNMNQYSLSLDMVIFEIKYLHPKLRYIIFIQNFYKFDKLYLDRFFYSKLLLLISLENPVIMTDSGIKLNPDKMIKEELYHCIYENRIFLFFKDNDDVLHCYEVSDLDTINKIKQTPENIDDILNNLAKDYSKRNED